MRREFGEPAKTTGGAKMSKRRDICKCDRLIVWDTDDKEVICRHCGARYSVEAGSFSINTSVAVAYWLEEKIEKGPRYKTDAK